jgi:hypothetical protein
MFQFLSAVWQMLLRGFVFGILRRLIIILSTPVVLLIATPIILVRATILASCSRQRFRFAVGDGFRSVWHGLFVTVAWPYYSELDTLQQMHANSSNQALQPTADRLENYKGETRK